MWQKIKESHVQEVQNPQKEKRDEIDRQQSKLQQ
jgi:hypothetical protein